VLSFTGDKAKKISPPTSWDMNKAQFYDVKYGNVNAWYDDDQANDDLTASGFLNSENATLTGKYRLQVYIYDADLQNYYSQTYFFEVSNNFVNAIPEIGTLELPDAYRVDGDTYSFAVPAITDDNTAAANIITEYQLLQSDDTLIKQLDKPENGKVTIDLADISNNEEVKVAVRTIDFANMQSILKNATPKVNWVPSKITESKFTIYDKTDTSTVEYKYQFADYKYYDKATKEYHTYDSSAEYKAGEKSINGQGIKFYQNTKVYLPKFTANISAKSDARISVSVFQINAKGEHVNTHLYYAGADGKSTPVIVGSKIFNNTSVSIKDWYFTPTNKGVYYIKVTTKANASNKEFTFVMGVDILSNSVPSVDFTSAGVNTSNVQALAIPSSTSVSVGAGWKFADVTMSVDVDSSTDSKKVYGKNRLLYGYSGDVLDYSNPVGNYEIEIQGVNDYFLTGSQIIPNTAGTYKIIYKFHLNDGTEINDKTFTLTATANDSSTASIKLADMYLTDAVNGKITEVKGGSTIEALVLENFLNYNVGGETSFNVTDDILGDESLVEVKESGATYIGYPLIAVPKAKSSVTGVTFDVKVQKSGNTDTNGSAIYEFDTAGTEDAIKTKTENSLVGGYYTFRPTGRFKSSPHGNNNSILGYISQPEESYKNDISGVYIVTYTMHNNGTDTELTFNITIGDPKVGELVVKDGAIKDILPESKIEYTVGDQIYIDITKLDFSGNEKFYEYIRTDGNSGADLTEEEKNTKMRNYIGKNLSIYVYIDGESYAYTGAGTSEKQLTKGVLREEDGTKIFASDGLTAEETDKINNGNGLVYAFTPSNAGTYKVSMSLWNPFSNNSASTYVEMTVKDVEVSKDNLIDPSNIWGIILIVLSSGLLIGVVFYFIKTGRETKFITSVTPKAEKKVKPEKAKEDKEVKESKGDKEVKTKEDKGDKEIKSEGEGKEDTEVKKDGESAE
jgi:hypothetical protein